MAGNGVARGVRIAFAECVFDSDTREVFRGGGALALSPKAFGLLEPLVRDRPKALSKKKTHGKLWPKVSVSDASHSILAAETRVALGDEAIATLAEGDEVQVGLATIAFRVLQETGSTQTVSGLRRARAKRS